MKKIILLSSVLLSFLQLSAQPGELDSSFGTNGTVTIPFNTGTYTPIAIQADGKIIIGGANLARYNMDGSLDTTFAGGIFHTSDNFPIGALAIQADEKIVVATEASINNNFGGTVNLYRYNKDGSPDMTFDGDGMKTTTLSWGSPEDLVNDISIVIQSDNKIIVAASGIQRFNADGSLDKSFGPDFYIGSAAVQKDGKIVVAGFRYETEVYNINFGVARYNVDGTPDLSFSNDGLQTIDFNLNDFANSIVIQDDGRIVITGHADNGSSNVQLALVRLNTDGSLDNSFSEDGKLTDYFLGGGDGAIGYSGIIQSDGKIIVGGYNYSFVTGGKAAIARYNTDGSIDSSFANNGKQVSTIGDHISSMAIFNKKLYTVGSQILARYQLFNNAATSVRITSPFNNQSITGPTTINISASAIAPGGTISKVDFYNGTTLLFSDDTSPYNFIWEDVSLGNYLLTAKATDNTGLIVTSPEVHITVVPDKAPVVSLTSPANNSIYGGPSTVILNASATDGDPDGTISKVDFYSGSTLLYSDNSSPYGYTWENVPVGEYALSAKATDNTGNVSTSPVVNFTMKKDSPPVVSITSPSDNATFTGPATIAIGIAAKDTDDYLVKLYIYSDTTLIFFSYVDDGELNYTYNWSNVSIGDYTLKVKVIDRWGVSTTSAPVHVSVTRIPQVITFTSPVDNAIYGSPVNINLAVNATDADNVTKVDYYRGTTLIGTGFSRPYNFTWINVPLGDYTLVAKATDNSGVVTTSASVHISVAPNKPPMVSLKIPYSMVKFTAPASIKLNATASDEDGTIAKVQFYYGTTLLHTEHKTPYGDLFADVPVGNYTLTAKAIDNSGAITTSNAINVSVVSENVPPVVYIKSPVNDTTFTGPASIRLIAAAKHPTNEITKVEFYNGTTLIRTEHYRPYAYTWNNVQPGIYVLTAVATDDKGFFATSASVKVTVKSDEPFASINSRESSIKSTNANNVLSLHTSPNPVHNTLNISINGLLYKPAELYILSASGVVIKNIHSVTSSEVQLDVSSLVNGVYFIKVISGNKVIYKRFVKL